MTRHMKHDCGFQSVSDWFRYRTGAILIHDNKMLFVKCHLGNYFYMIGGGVQLGETSQACIEREVFEETGIKARADHLAVVCENFFKGKGGLIDGLDCHTIEFYYSMTIDDLSSIKQTTDIGQELVWLSLDDMTDSLIKPDFIKHRLAEIIASKQTLHIIDETDR